MRPSTPRVPAAYGAPPPFVSGHSSSSMPRQRRGGFALLITITLLAFLVLLLVSLASLTRVETQVASNTQQLAQARQNALMALNIALGQLQKHTGPDQRVTATADLQPVAPSRPKIDPASGVDLTASNALSSVNQYWQASRNRRWTGTWKNSNTTDFADTADTPAGFNPAPTLEAWLVSGNEQANDFTPDTALTGLAFNSTALDDSITDSNGVTHRLLVGPRTTGAFAAADLDRLVTAPQRTITATNVPGTNGAPTTVGHYAWWVGDEGVKARANLADPYATIATPEAKISRLQSAQRSAIEAMSTNGSDGLASLDPSQQGNLPNFHTDLLNIVNADQLAYLNAAVTLPAELKARFHDLSVSSRGLLADPKHGGLKRDLSYVLSRPNVASFQTALKAAYADTAYDPTSEPHNSPFNEHTTPYTSKFPSIGTDRYFDLTYEGSSAPGDASIFTYGATWEQLWSFYNMGNLKNDTPAGVFTGSNQVAARPVSPTQQGLYPIIAKGQIFYRLRYDAAGVIWVDVTPIVVLANPYNVTLSGDFHVRLVGFEPQLRFGSPTNLADPQESEFTQPGGSFKDLKNCYLGDIQLVVRASGIPPGAAQIFMVDPDGETTIASVTDSHVVDLINDFDEDACLTYNTGLTRPSDKTHAALYTGSSGPTAEMFIGGTTDYQNRVAQYNTHRPSTSGMAKGGFLVNPVASGIQQGGGVWFTYEDGTWSIPQQATFYQVNYRALRIDSSGYGTPNNHPLQWVDTWVRYGVTGSHSETSMPAANPFLAANLMLPPGGSSSAASTRWGLVNNGSGGFFNTTTTAIGGASSQVSLVNILFDLPKPGRPITSLGQLQHFNTAGHAHNLVTSQQAKDANARTIVHQWQVNYPISNSYPHPRVNRDQVFDMRGDFSYHYDGSYLWNDILWDRFYFSSYPQSGSFDFASDQLINARYRPFRPTTEVPSDDEDRFRGVFLAAQNLLADGAFNVNSTSVEAWKAVFSSLKNVPIGSESVSANLTAPFSRVLDPIGGSTDAKTGNSENAWNGFRNLTVAEVNALAEAMVLQVRLRGPFLSLSEFVNRRLVTTSKDAGINLGLGGALQTAIDSVLNKQSDIQGSPFDEKTGVKGNNNNRTHLAELAYRMPSRISGFPGYLLQGDVLSSLGPTLAARSDTFTIRTYGDVVSPVDSSQVLGRAWCEAVVQRIPDYVVPRSGSSGNAPDEVATDPANINFGRRYQIISFRWLSPEDV